MWPVRSWFLEIVSSINVDLCVCLCVRVHMNVSVNYKSHERHV